MKGTIRAARSIVILGAAIVAQPAHAESASEAITAFGLVGTWSATCERDPVKGCDLSGRVVPACPSRIVFEAPSSGAPTRTTITARFNGIPLKTATALTSAARMTSDRIRLTWVFEGQQGTPAPAYAQFPQNGEVWEQVLEKSGGKLKVVEFQREDGKKILVRDGFQYRPASGSQEKAGPPPPPLEKCVD